MSADKPDKTRVDSAGRSDGLVSYLITLVQMTLVGLLLLLGLIWISLTIDLWLNPRATGTESLKYLPHLIGLVIIVYLLGYLNGRLNPNE